jgi:hypothetical protein
VQNIFSKKWEQAVVIKKLEYPRSYLVQMCGGSGKVLRRNSKFIKKYHSKFRYDHLFNDRISPNINRKIGFASCNRQNNQDDDRRASGNEGENVNAESWEENQNGNNIRFCYRTRAGRLVKPTHRLSL